MLTHAAEPTTTTFNDLWAAAVADAGSIFPEITEGPKTQPVICGADGNVKRISDRSGTREMDWDHGRLTTTEYLNGSLVLAGYQLTNSYDKGRRTGVTLTKNGVPIHQVSFERGNYLWNESQK